MFCSMYPKRVVIFRGIVYTIELNIFFHGTILCSMLRVRGPHLDLPLDHCACGTIPYCEANHLSAVLSLKS